MICYHNWRYSAKRKGWYCSNAAGGCTKRVSNLTVTRDRNNSNGKIEVLITSHPGKVDMNHQMTLDRVYKVIGMDYATAPATVDNGQCSNTFEDIDDC